MAINLEVDAQDREYTRRLVRVQRVWWKRWLDVQAPYRRNLLQLQPGLTLEVGCGIGRNLRHLGGNGVGVDHNRYSVLAAREWGLRAYTPDEFHGSEWDRPARFDSLLLSHVAEHMHRDQLLSLLREHLEYVRSGGLLILITPQELGFRSDPTHVEFMDTAVLRGVADELGLLPVRDYSHPFPRRFGRVFIYNQFVSVSRKP
jgi:SAM-dependent methyltransferase